MRYSIGPADYTAPVLFRTGGKPSTWFPPGELVEQTPEGNANIKNTYILYEQIETPLE